MLGRIEFERHTHTADEPIMTVILRAILTVVTGNETTAKNTNPKRQRGKHFTRKSRRNLFASLALRVNIRTVCATSRSVSEGL